MMFRLILLPTARYWVADLLPDTEQRISFTEVQKTKTQSTKISASAEQNKNTCGREVTADEGIKVIFITFPPSPKPVTEER